MSKKGIIDVCNLKPFRNSIKRGLCERRKKTSKQMGGVFSEVLRK